MELAQACGRSPRAILEMYNVVLDHVIKYDAPAMRLVISKELLPAFASALRERGNPERHCF